MPHSPPHAPPRPEATIREVKAWIKSIDTNNDGVISKEELATALHDLRFWFANWRAGRAVKNADLNHNGCIDTPEEFMELESFTTLLLMLPPCPRPSELGRRGKWRRFSPSEFCLACFVSSSMGVITLQCTIPHPPPQAPRPDATIQEIKAWVKSLDNNNDGVISKEELVAGLRGLHVWFARWNGRRTMKNADLNGNGIIDNDAEFLELESFVQSHWGHRIRA
ncbi:uncharacterized protein LOC131224003 [Magnolia sinica]|uniref:uncharacterized protein LOC131224003 n=1 Tax=Magnolia sinica TaxID=86752 RepID=UPI002659C5A0|nr:uncharacterized protein LOC131224003 [Magnolia sinica]